MEPCMYCEPGEKLNGLMELVSEMRVSTLFLLRDQSFKGRCVLMFEEHCKEIDEMPEDKMLPFMQDLSAAVSAIRSVFNPEKVNYAIFGDEVPHLHIHLVPKYWDGALWGKPFCAQTVEALRVPEDSWKERIENLRRELNSNGGIFNG